MGVNQKMLIKLFQVISKLLALKESMQSIHVCDMHNLRNKITKGRPQIGLLHV